MNEKGTCAQSSNQVGPESFRTRKQKGATPPKGEKQNQLLQLLRSLSLRRNRTPANSCIYVLALMTVAVITAAPSRAQQVSGLDRDRALDMLDKVAREVQKHYYDQNFHGLDWNAKVLESKKKIRAENSFNMALAHIAAALDSLNDSHTFLLPPPRPYRHDYGFRTEIVGDRCYIDRVRPGSDAEAKGVKRGDEVLAINGFKPTRDNLWKMDYTYRVLRPQPGLRVGLRNPDGQERQADVAAKVKETKRMADLTSSSGANDLWDVIREEENEEHLMRARTVEMG